MASKSITNKCKQAIYYVVCVLLSNTLDSHRVSWEGPSSSTVQVKVTDQSSMCHWLFSFSVWREQKLKWGSYAYIYSSIVTSYDKAVCRIFVFCFSSDSCLRHVVQRCLLHSQNEGHVEQPRKIMWKSQDSICSIGVSNNSDSKESKLVSFTAPNSFENAWISSDESGFKSLAHTQNDQPR